MLPYACASASAGVTLRHRALSQEPACRLRQSPYSTSLGTRSRVPGRPPRLSPCASMRHKQFCLDVFLLKVLGERSMIRTTLFSTYLSLNHDRVCASIFLL